jgi:Mn-dependent DtxR family transcriptional regulator
MNSDAMVLRAMLRLARRRVAADEDEIALRVGKSSASVRASLRRLDALGLVEPRFRGGARLTMGGLALALAMLPRGSRATSSTLRSPRAA